MDVLEEHSHKECVCLGEWLRSANKILNFSDISKREFAWAIQTTLEKGKRKKQNVMLIGPTNCGKSFLLNPLKDISNAFVNPANSTFACVGAETAEIVHLNDFRWDEKIIAWADMLTLLEGAPVHIAAPILQRIFYGQILTQYFALPMPGSENMIMVRWMNWKPKWQMPNGSPFRVVTSFVSQKKPLHVANVSPYF